MNLQETTTLERLRNLDLDAADAAFPFSARLARDNGWSRAFAAAAIEEYRKFCFLAVHAGHPVIPSDEVDQVWHLHLTYSLHYSEALCRGALGKPLQHGPTKGGAAEDRKFRQCYEATLASYRRYFGEPRKDLWPDAHERFDGRHEFVRIDRRDILALDRALLERGTVAAVGAGGLVAVAHALAQTDGVGAASAGSGPFVVLVAVVLAGVLIAAAVRGKRARKPHRSKRRNPDGALAAGAAAPGGDSSCNSANANCADGVSADGGAGGCGSSGCGGGGS
jgi:hypothetical protein